jgi:DNA-binding response OmpR family regulator
LQEKWTDVSLTILVLEEIEETRDGIWKLLKADGYHVTAVRNEEEAVENALRIPPDLILASRGQPSRNVVRTAISIRERAHLGEQVPVVIFCMEEVDEGGELEIGQNIFLTRPDNFNQLRKLIARLMSELAGDFAGMKSSVLR